MKRFTLSFVGLAPIYATLEVSAVSAEEALKMGETILEDWKRGRADLDWQSDLDGDIPDGSLGVDVLDEEEEG